MARPLRSTGCPLSIIIGFKPASANAIAANRPGIMDQSLNILLNKTQEVGSSLNNDLPVGPAPTMTIRV